MLSNFCFHVLVKNKNSFPKLTQNNLKALGDELNINPNQKLSTEAQYKQIKLIEGCWIRRCLLDWKTGISTFKLKLLYSQAHS